MSSRAGQGLIPSAGMRGSQTITPFSHKVHPSLNCSYMMKWDRRLTPVMQDGCLYGYHLYLVRTNSLTYYSRGLERRFINGNVKKTKTSGLGHRERDFKSSLFSVSPQRYNCGRVPCWKCGVRSVFQWRKPCPCTIPFYILGGCSLQNLSRNAGSQANRNPTPMGS